MEKLSTKQKTAAWVAFATAILAALQQLGYELGWF